MKRIQKFGIIIAFIPFLFLSNGISLAKGKKKEEIKIPYGWEKGEKKGWKEEMPPGFKKGEKKGWEGDIPPGFKRGEKGKGSKKDTPNGLKSKGRKIPSPLKHNKKHNKH